MNDLEKKHLREWLKTAHSDLDAAEKLFSNDEDVYILKICCFHLQQSIEKYLKAYIIFYKIDPPYTHDIAILLNMCVNLDSAMGVFDIRQINDFAVSARYPDSTYIPDLSDIHYYFSLTRQIETYITSKIVIE